MMVDLPKIEGITSASVEKYLLLKGWSRNNSFKNPRMWVFENDLDPELVIAIPASESATDFCPRIYSIIQTLAAFDNKSEQEIIDSLK